MNTQSQIKTTLRTFVAAIDSNDSPERVEGLAAEYARLTGNDYREDRGQAMDTLAEINAQVVTAARVWNRMRRSATSYRPAVEHATHTLALLLAKRAVRCSCGMAA